jgi:hypothetical protein
MKHSLAAVACAAALVATVAACGAAKDKSALPGYTGGSSPTVSATSDPRSTPSKPSATTDGPVALVAHSTNTYGDLKFTVDLPTDIPSASRPSMRLFSGFLQAVGRTIATNKPDPSLADLTSPSVLSYFQKATGGESVQGIGAVTFRISEVKTGKSGFSLITGCVDQSQLVQVRKDGSHFVDDDGKKYPTLKITANVAPGKRAREVTSFTYGVGSC